MIPLFFLLPIHHQWRQRWWRELPLPSTILLHFQFSGLIAGVFRRPCCLHSLLHMEFPDFERIAKIHAILSTFCIESTFWICDEFVTYCILSSLLLAFWVLRRFVFARIFSVWVWLNVYIEFRMVRLSCELFCSEFGCIKCKERWRKAGLGTQPLRVCFQGYNHLAIYYAGHFF